MNVNDIPRYCGASNPDGLSLDYGYACSEQRQLFVRPLQVIDQLIAKKIIISTIVYLQL